MSEIDTPEKNADDAPVADGGGDAKPRSGRLPRGWTIAILAVLAVLVLLAGTLTFIAGIRALNARITGSNTACNAARVADRVLPSMVTVDVTGGGGGSVGSGEVITADGYILTNNHVISPAASGGSIAVRFSDGHAADARLVGRDPKTDLAVLHVSGETSLPVIPSGDSGALVVGQPVVALGSPLGLSSTVTAGIVSALGRTVPVPSDNGQNAILVGAIQTDASINPGNSGGALVDCSGRFVGVNTAIATVPNQAGDTGGGSVGIGFAVPEAVALPIAHELIDHGSVSYPSAGIDVVPIPHSVAVTFGIDDGLFVRAVDQGGPADQAGLKPGDVITHLNGQQAGSVDQLTILQITSKAGDEVMVDYIRNGRHESTTVVLANGG